MIRIFRINDPYRLILVFIFLVILKLPFLIHGEIYSILDLKHHLIGEKLGSGVLLYKDLWDNIAPFSAWFYMFIDYLFGKSAIAYQIIAIFLFFFQAGLFNVILIRKKAYNENSYVPAFFYMLFGFMFFDVISLSPQLLGLTFILFSLDSLFIHLELRRKNDINLINLGMYIGIAALFYLPYIIYLISVTLGLLLYTNTIRRRYFLMYYGAIFVFLLIWIYYFLKGDSHYLMQNLVYPLLRFDYSNYLTFNSLLYIAVVPGIFLLISLFKTFQTLGYTNYQVRIQSLFFLFFIFQIITWFLWSQKSGASLVIYVPTMSFFVTHMFINVRKRLWREIYFYLLVVAVLGVYLNPIYRVKYLDDKIALDKTLVRNINGWDVENKKILVLGDDLSYYKNNSLATPFLNWDNARRLFLNINDYENILTVFSNLKTDYPEYIIDQNGVLPDLMNYIPELKMNYSLVKDNVYQKTNN